MTTTRVLVVDDATTIRMFFEAVLLAPDREVLTARDGEEALQIVAEVTPDLAFVDINMPGMDGYELVRRLRGLPETAGMPVVMCSTESKPVDELRAYAAGANYYVRKPAPKTVIEDLARVLLDPTGLEVLP